MPRRRESGAASFLHASERKGSAMRRGQVISLIVAAIVVLSAFVILTSGMLPYRVFIVHTGSMEPTISSRSAVIVREHTYRVGQAISFYEQGGVITHRLIRINADGTATTKGDANSTPDPWKLKPSAIIGEVIASPPEVGYWLMYLRNPFGLTSVFISILVCWQLSAFSTHAPTRHRRVKRHTMQNVLV